MRIPGFDMVLAMPGQLVTGALVVSGVAVDTTRTAARLPADAAELLSRAAQLIDRVETVLDHVEEQVTGASVALRRVDDLVELFAPAVGALAPLAGEVADRARPQHVAAIFQGLDLLPELTGMIVPAVRNLVELIPELDLLIERLDNVGKIVEGLPGARRFKRRGEANQGD